MRSRHLAGIDCVLDVGANAGQWAMEARRLGYRGRIVSFEPGTAAFGRLQRNLGGDELWSSYPIALGEAPAHARFFVTTDSVSSSLLAPITNDRAPGFLAGSWDGEVEVARLDDLANGLPLGNHNYLKMDVQGFEVEVLKGAKRTLSRVSIIEVEASLQLLYEGQALIEELFAELRSAGFTPSTIIRGYTDPTTVDMIQVDCFFRR